MQRPMAKRGAMVHSDGQETIMDVMAGIWGWVVVLGGGFVLGGVILWAMAKNRKEPQSEIDATERATRQNYVDQDAKDKADDVRN